MAGLDKSSMFAEGIKKLCNGSIDFDTHTIKAFLMKRSFSTAGFTDTLRDTAVNLNEIASGDRAKNTAKVVGTNDILVDRTNNNVNFGESTVSITFPTVTSGVVCKGILIFKSSGATETASPLICFNSFTTKKTADGGTFTVNLNADGLFQASFD